MVYLNTPSSVYNGNNTNESKTAVQTDADNNVAVWSYLRFCMSLTHLYEHSIYFIDLATQEDRCILNSALFTILTELTTASMQVQRVLWLVAQALMLDKQRWRVLSCRSATCRRAKTTDVSQNLCLQTKYVFKSLHRFSNLPVSWPDVMTTCVARFGRAITATRVNPLSIFDLNGSACTFVKRDLWNYSCRLEC